MTEWNPVPSTYDPLKAGSIDGTDTVPHDRAIFRAMNSTYKPNKDVVGNPNNTIFVGRLSPHTDDETLEKCFCKYGEIKRLRLMRDVVTGFSKCYAFIEYYDEDVAYRSQRHLDKTVLDEKEIFVDFECERTLKGWIPRRLGGGIGGKKESGQLRFGGKSRPFKKPFKVETIKLEGDSRTFRDRLRAVERGEAPDRARDHIYRQERDGDNDRDKYRSKDRYRQRSRSRDRGQRSRSQDRGHRSRSRDKRRSRSRGRDQSRRKGK